MHQEKQGSATIVVTCLEPNHCSQQSSNVSWLKPSSTHQLTGDYGAGAIRGCVGAGEAETRDRSTTRLGRAFCGSATVRVCLDRSIQKPTRKRSVLLKNCPRNWRRSAGHIHKPAWNCGARMSTASLSRPILRRVWALKGSAVKAVVAHLYKWMYVYACVHPESGRTSWLLLPEVQPAERCRWLQAHAALIHSYTCFHWWPSSSDTP
jgi:hypothetical protein